jgi:hypothetical protein
MSQQCLKDKPQVNAEVLQKMLPPTLETFSHYVRFNRREIREIHQGYRYGGANVWKAAWNHEGAASCFPNLKRAFAIFSNGTAIDHRTRKTIWPKGVDETLTEHYRFPHMDMYPCRGWLSSGGEGLFKDF